jgi:uncharacterized protein YqgC (DUF456 family)
MESLWIIITVLIMLVGLVGTFIPFLPGIPLIYGCYIFYGLGTGWKAYGAGAIIAWTIVTAATMLLDFYAGSLGAKRYGASKAGMWGSILGGIIGTVAVGFPGLIIGPFVGAVAGELMAGRSHPEALRSGWGTIIGFLGGSLLKIAVGVVMIGTFLWWVVF